MRGRVFRAGRGGFLGHRCRWCEGLWGGAVFAGFGDGLGGAVAGWVVGVDRDFSRGFGDALEAAERVVGVEGRAFGVLLFEQANQATGAVVFACDFFFSALL